MLPSLSLTVPMAPPEVVVPDVVLPEVVVPVVVPPVVDAAGA